MTKKETLNLETKRRTHSLTASKKRKQLREIDLLISATNRHVKNLWTLTCATNSELIEASQIINKRIKTIQGKNAQREKNRNKFHGFALVPFQKAFHSICDLISAHELYYLTEQLTYCHQIISARHNNQTEELFWALEEKTKLYNKKIALIKGKMPKQTEKEQER